MASPAAQKILTRPKGTYKTRSTDLGDYYKRFGLKRIIRHGRLTVVPAWVQGTWLGNYGLDVIESHFDLKKALKRTQ